MKTNYIAITVFCAFLIVSYYYRCETQRNDFLVEQIAIRDSVNKINCCKIDSLQTENDNYYLTLKTKMK